MFTNILKVYFVQIRLTNGQSIVQAFNVKEVLAAVRVYIELNRSDGDAPFSLMTSFPRKVFTNEDYEKPLEQLGNEFEFQYLTL